MTHFPIAPCGCCRPQGRSLGRQLGRRGLLGAMAGFACLAATGARAADYPRTTLGPDQALARLMAGNARFVGGNVRADAADPVRRMTLAAGQAPFAAILGCADSRTPPEILFEAGLGEIFAVRNAGNLADTGAIGSLEYAVAALGVPLVMVLGHESCGAVSGALAMAESDERLPGRINTMLEPILPAALAALRSGPEAGKLDRAVRENVIRSVGRLGRESPVLAAAVAAGNLRILGARYDLDEGKVVLLD